MSDLPSSSLTKRQRQSSQPPREDRRKFLGEKAFARLGVTQRPSFFRGIGFQPEVFSFGHLERQLLNLLIGQRVIPDADIVDDSVHVLALAGVADGHYLAGAHQARFAIEGDRLFAISVEIQPAFFFVVVDDVGDQIPTANFEITTMAANADFRM